MILSGKDLYQVLFPRSHAFDAAFKSRIHLAIKYPNLSHSTRKVLWTAFIFRAAPEAGLEWVNSASLDKIGRRRIKWSANQECRTYRPCVGREPGHPLSLSHVMALDAMKTFDIDFEESTAKRRA